MAAPWQGVILKKKEGADPSSERRKSKRRHSLSGSQHGGSEPAFGKKKKKLLSVCRFERDPTKGVVLNMGIQTLIFRRGKPEGDCGRCRFEGPHEKSGSQNGGSTPSFFGRRETKRKVLSVCHFEALEKP